MKFLCWLFVWLYLGVSGAHAQGFVPPDLQNSSGIERKTISVVSSSQGQEIFHAIANGWSAQISDETPAAGVCFFKQNQLDSCADVTSPTPTCVPAKQWNGYTASTREEAWVGRVCTILASGSTAVTIIAVRW